MKIGNHIGDRIYIKDDTFAWLPATIVGFAENRTLVKIELPPEWQEVTEDGVKQNLEEERWIDPDDYRDRKLPLQNEESNSTRDCADLLHLHEAALLYQIKDRHLQGNPYTRCGDIIVAVNPCASIKVLYSFQKGIVYAKSFVWQCKLASLCVSDFLFFFFLNTFPCETSHLVLCTVEGSNATTATSEDSHREEKKDEHDPITSTSFGSIYNRLGIEPHLYEVSALAYRGVFLDGKNQTILGKT
jgi:myosin heavy subunit